MLLELIEVHSFRNLSGKVSWGSGLNIIYGDNGQGKSNWLEAIYLLATTKSFRTQRPQEAINYNKQQATIRGSVTRSQEIRRELQITIQGNLKSLLVNSKREAVASYLGHFHAVPFTAQDLEVVRGGPEARRRFLDRGVVTLQHTYLQTLTNYQRIIKQKNRLLQDAAKFGVSFNDMALQVEPWNVQLIDLSNDIYKARSNYVERLQQSLEHRMFSTEEINIRYASSLEGKGNLKDYQSLIAERLRLRLKAEISAGYSLVGPHRDDLEILFNGRDIRTFGSSGQQRSALILLDLAAIAVYHSWHNEYPIFLLDDIDAELDKKRIRKLLDHLGNRIQTFITTSNDSLAESYKSCAYIFEVANGMAKNIT